MLNQTLNPVDEVLQAYRDGEIIIVVDDEDRENEGDFIMAAEKVTAASINFMAKHGRGLICMPITEERAADLELPVMVDNNTALHETSFTISIDARKGTSTGISAADRATTVQTVIAADSSPKDLARPGHIFPLVARNGGVLERSGHTEATVDLARLAGMFPAGVLCEIMDDDGSMARLPRLIEMAAEHNLRIVSIRDLIHYRTQKERLVRMVDEEVDLPSMFGSFRVRVYENVLNGDRHLAIFKGELDSETPTLVRVHSSCLMGDVFGSTHWPNTGNISECMRMIEEEGRGALIYLRGRDSRGLGLFPKSISPAADAHHTKDTENVLRNLGIGAQIIKDLGLRRLKILTNNPKQYVGLDGHGLEVAELVPITTEVRSHS